MDNNPYNNPAFRVALLNFCTVHQLELASVEHKLMSIGIAPQLSLQYYTVLGYWPDKAAALFLEHVGLYNLLYLYSVNISLPLPDAP